MSNRMVITLALGAVVVICVLGFCAIGAWTILIMRTPSTPVATIATREPVNVVQEQPTALSLPTQPALPTMPPATLTRAATATRVSIPTAVPTNPPASGSSRANPAPIGTSVTWVYWNGGQQIAQKVLQVKRGDAAWQQIKAANMFNKPPAAGLEYVLISLQSNYLKGDAAKPYQISDADCAIVSSDGRIFLAYEDMTVPPEPQFRREVYPGASVTGWSVITSPAGDPNPVLQCGRKYDGTGGAWFALK